jgi:penicillin-insensitive murein endopeptidase
MKVLLLLLFLVDPPDAGVAPAPATPPSPTAATWGAIKLPGDGKPRAIGKYGGGCLDGAAKLPLEGKGFFVTRPERGRIYGHPLLVALIEDLGKKLQLAHLGRLPVGDLSQPRGGPAPTGHASHQTGLDVDLWYLPPENGKSPAVVDVDHHKLNARWSKAVARLIELAARDPRIDRMFVNPAIKRELCASTPAVDRGWLRKVRPWWGHHDHFHVRLPCPEDSPQCEGQPPLGDGDGCGELGWWFQKKSDERDKGRKDYQGRVGASPALPTPCLSLVPDPAVPEKTP